MIISLNPRWRLQVLGADSFKLFKQSGKGGWTEADQVEGTRRRLLKRLDKHGIVPTARAERFINLLPERAAFGGGVEDGA